MIFKQVTACGFSDYKEAEAAAVVFYTADETVSRAGISHALKRLEKHFNG